MLSDDLCGSGGGHGCACYKTICVGNEDTVSAVAVSILFSYIND